MKTIAAIYKKKNKPIVLEEIEFNLLKSNEVIVKMYASGICHAQLINLSRDPKHPELLGHEGTGKILFAGKNVKHVKEGDDVLISWMPCNSNAKSNFLERSEIKYRGKKISTSLFTFSKHSILHKQFVTRLPKNIEKYKSSIIGCAGIAGYGSVYNTVKINKNDSVAIFGLGGLGVLAANAAKNLKARKIIGVDLDNKKLKYSKQFGVTHCINNTNSDPVKQILQITKGKGVDFVFDMVGKSSTQIQSISSVKKCIPGYESGGSVVIVGFPREKLLISTRDILMGEIKLIGSRGGGVVPLRDFQKFYRDYRSGKLLINKAVTRIFKLNEINKALNLLSKGKILGRSIVKIN